MKYLLSFAILLVFGSAQAQDPSAPQFTSVSIDPSTGNVVAKWHTPPENNISYHLISRVPFSGPTFTFADPPTDTVFMPDTVFTETVADLDLMRQTYRILSVNSIGRVSAITNAHITMILGAEYNSCDNEINLRWTEYKQLFINNATGLPVDTNTETNVFNNGVEYEVWGHHGALFDITAAQKITERSKNHTDVMIKNLTVNTTYFLFVKALLPNGDTATSNKIVVSTANKKLPTIIAIDSVISESGNIKLHFVLDKTTDIDTFSIRRADERVPLKWFFKLSDVPEWYSDSKISLGQVYTYNLVGYMCGNIVTSSDSVSNVLISAVPKGRETDIKWTEFVSETAGSGYTLSRTEPAPTEIVYSGTALNFTDTSTPDSLCSGPRNFCYQVTADNGQSVARSEISCITLEPLISFPDAIDPKSDIASTPDCKCRSGCIYRRSNFGPIIDVSDNFFEMTIEVFNRAGVKMFYAKKNYNQALDADLHYWNGTYKGEYVSEGVYVYNIRINFAAGDPVMQRGTVTVVY